MAALSGSASPSASLITAIVDAVPMTLHVPQDRDMHDSACMNCLRLIAPARTSSLKRHTSVPEPMSVPRNLPFNIVPPDTTIEGRSQLAAPMTSEGVVLSQPQSRTTPSIGLARIDSSTSMLARLRNSIAVGRTLVSPSDITGNSNGTPPASQTPRLTCSASSRKWPLQGVSSDQVLQIPMIGRPSKIPSGRPRPTQLRWMNPSLSGGPNHAADRYFRFVSSDTKSSQNSYQLSA